MIAAYERYVEGVTLKEYLKEEIQFDKRYCIIERILETMNEVYQKGLYYGDLHGNNIMIDKEGKVYIIDFGTSFVQGEKSHNRDCEKLIKLFSSTILKYLNDQYKLFNNEIKQLWKQIKVRLKKKVRKKPASFCYEYCAYVGIYIVVWKQIKSFLMNN